MDFQLISPYVDFLNRSNKILPSLAFLSMFVQDLQRFDHRMVLEFRINFFQSDMIQGGSKMNI